MALKLSWCLRLLRQGSKYMSSSYALDQSYLTLNAEIVFKSDENFGLKSVYAYTCYLQAHYKRSIIMCMLK
jgi:hypothetical protein